MIELRLNKDFDLDINKYLIKPKQTSELLITPDIPKQVSDAAPNPNVINNNQMAQLNDGLTMAENALLSDEEKNDKIKTTRNDNIMPNGDKIRTKSYKRALAFYLWIYYRIKERC